MNKPQTLLQRFMAFNGQKKLSGPKKRTLLAVSGGADSVVMAHLYKQAGYPFGIAHVNFQLRGGEADADEAFVQQLASGLQVPFYVNRFNTEAYAAQHNLSIQLAARQLRYNWFAEVMAANKYRLLATAHHLNDNIETILLNLIKGPSLRGLRGIPVKNGHIVRPLLFATREEVEEYCTQHQLTYRTDSSNQTDKYTRNYIRHQIVPLLKQINPALEKTMGDKIEVLAEVEQLYTANLSKAHRTLFLKRGADVYIPLLKLKKTPNAATVLFEYLSPMGFTYAQVEDMLAGLDAEPGKQYLGTEARIIKDRRFYILAGLKAEDAAVGFVQATDTGITVGNLTLTLETLTTLPANPGSNPHVAYLNAAEFQFPLTLRKWKAGDYFYPYGMGMKKKKVKKFLTDLKLPLHEKENVWVVESNQRIVWVVGHRIDERFKVTDNCNAAIKLTATNESKQA